MESVLIWCDLNAEQDHLEEVFGDLCFSIQGRTPDKDKVDYEQRWRDGERPVLITKSTCFGYGMNWQHCSKMIFVGLSDSYEMFYQAVRRCWRFGQTRPVDVYVIISEAEGAVKLNIERKEADARIMTTEMARYARQSIDGELRHMRNQRVDYNPQQTMIIPEWVVSE